MYPGSLPYALPLFVIAGLTSSIALYAFRRTTHFGASTFGWLMVAISWWSLAYAFQFLAPDLPGKVLAGQVSYFGISAVPPLWLAFALHYTGRAGGLTRRNRLLLATPAALTVGLMLTNSAHHLMWTGVSLDPTGFPGLLINGHGVWFWIHTLIAYTFVLIGIALYALTYAQAARVYRWQVGLVLAGSLGPLIGNAISLSGWFPISELDLTPFGFAISSLLLAIGFFRFGLLDLMPIAAPVVMENLREAVMVVDTQNRLVDLNLAACQLFGLSKAAIGHNVRDVLGPPEAVGQFWDVMEVQTELVIGEGARRRLFELTISPLRDARQSVLGRVAVVRDITRERVLLDAERRRAAQLTALQSVSQAVTSTLELNQIFETVVQVLHHTFDYRYVSIYRLEGGTLRLGAQVGYPAELIYEEIPITAGIMGRTVRTRQPQFVRDVRADPDFMRAVYEVESEICVPLLKEQTVLGTLNIESSPQHPLTEADVALLITFAGQVVVAIENARLFESERTQRELAEALRGAGAALSASLDFETVLDCILEQIGRVVPYDAANLMLIDAEHGRVRVARMRGYDQFGEPVARDIAAISFEIATTANLRWMAETGKPLVIPDTAAYPGWVAVEASTHVRSWAGAPIVAQGQVIAFFSVDKAEPGFFRPEHAERLAAFAGQAAAALENARLFAALRESEARDRALSEAAQRQTQELTLLDQVRQALARELELPLVIRTVVEGIAQTFGYTLVSLYLLDGEMLVLQHQVGYAQVIERFRITEGISGRVVRTGQSVLLEDVRSDPAFLGAIEGITSEVCVPLFDQGRVVGVLNVESTQGVKLGEADLHLMLALSEQVGIALGRARLYAEMRESQQRFASAVQYAAIGMALVAPDGRWLQVNRSLCELVGYTEPELLATTFQAITHPDDLETDLGHVRQMLAGEIQTYQMEKRYFHKHGHVVWILLSVSLVRDHQDRPLYFISQIQDITERKRAEAALRQSEARYHGLFEDSAISLWEEDFSAVKEHLDALRQQGVTDFRAFFQGHPAVVAECAAQVKVTDVNAATLRLYRASSKADLLQNLERVFLPESYDAFVEELVSIAEGRAKFEWEGVNQSLAGERLVVRLHWSVVQGYEDTLAKVIISLVDVTERQRAEEALRESEARFRAVAQSASDAIVVANGQGEIVLWNLGAERLFLYTPEEALGQPVSRLIPAGYLAQHRRAVERRHADAMRPAGAIYEARGMRKDGSECPVEISVAEWETPQGKFFSAIIRDTTERKRAEQALHDSEVRYALATRGANDGLWDWDLKSNQIYFSERWKAMLGWTEPEIGNNPEEWFSRVHADDVAQLKAQLAAHLEGATQHFESEHRMRHQDGAYRWMLNRGLAVWDSAGRAYRMAGSLTDITEHKRAEEQLRHGAYHDTLTGLPNRTLFLDRLRQALERAHRRPDYAFAVLFLDFDRFKVVNDSLGHTVGDQLLVAIAQRLAACLRALDTVARLGGDEFVILLEDVPELTAVTYVADRIQAEVTKPFLPSGHEVFTSASIGIVLSTPAYERPDDLLRDADAAMYRAKALGKARYEVFQPDMRLQAVARQALETDLRRAVEQHEFRVHYQPIVFLATGRVTGFEALLRWRHPERGLVLPEAFMTTAEETGLIVPMGHWLLQEACGQLRVWQSQYPAEPPLTMSVNLSSQQFQQPELDQQIERLLNETGLAPSSLKLEITERTIIEDTEATVQMLARLKALGVQLEIDDFGTGYSALSYLQRLQLDALKIDRSFVQRLGSQGTHTAIVRTIIALGQQLGLQILAEGVETADQVDKLKALGCQNGQGFLFGKPMTSEEVMNQVAAGWQATQPPALGRGP